MELAARGVQLAVHAGAGGSRRRPHGELFGEREPANRLALAESLEAGSAVLEGGGSALDAVVAAVAVLEAHPDFNAGLGSVLTAAGRVEMDAAVMDGARRRFGGVAAVTGLASPVHAARAVCDDGRHVLLAGEGAEAFARAHGLELVPPEALVTPLRRRQLEEALAAGRVRLDHDGSGAGEGGGTVGAVARDVHGHLAAATSTGGMTAKRPGRVGDTPLPGAGTWADDTTCAVSGTGTGEAYARTAFGHQVDARIRYQGLSLGGACRAALDDVRALGGRGGCIALAGTGAPVLPFDTAAMPRGCLDAAGRPRVALYDEALAPVSSSRGSATGRPSSP